MSRFGLNFAEPERQRGKPLGLVRFTFCALGYSMLTALSCLLIAHRL
jgi:hypothetical protein